MAEDKNKRVVKMHELYDNGKVQRKHCPKCGPGVFMAEHGNRTTCGKCGYTEFNRKDSSESEGKETPKEESNKEKPKKETPKEEEPQKEENAEGKQEEKPAEEDSDKS